MNKLKAITLFFALIVFFSLNAKQEKSVQSPKLPKVAIFLTGGTIAEKTDPKTGASVPVASGKDLINSIPKLKEIADIEVIDFSNIDSSQMTPQIWAKLSQSVDKELENPQIIGAVIAHGTDEMADAAYFLDVTLKTNKNVVFTGAMRNVSDPYPDGPPNLINSVYQVISPHADNWGVTINMNQYIQSPAWAEKTQTTNLQTFESGEKGYLGYVFNGKVFRINDRLNRNRLSLVKELPRVDLIIDYAGSDGSFVRAAIDKGAKGIVVESVGSGNVNEKTYYAIKYAIDQGLIVVITTRVPHGIVFPSYGDIGGGKLLKELGAILTGNLRAPKARLLLMLALPLYGKDHHKLAELLHRP